MQVSRTSQDILKWGLTNLVISHALALAYANGAFENLNSDIATSIVISSIVAVNLAMDYDLAETAKEVIAELEI